jgi:hypothetical protein
MNMPNKKNYKLIQENGVWGTQYKKLAGDAWEKFKKFSDDVSLKVKEYYGKALDYIDTSYQSFKVTLSKGYQEALLSINQAYEAMKDKAQAFGETCKGIWSDILEESALLIQAMKEKFVAMKESVNQWFTKNKADLEKSVSEAKTSGIESLSKLGDTISNILSKATKTAVEFGAVALFICILPIVLLIRGNSNPTSFLVKPFSTKLNAVTHSAFVKFDAKTAAKCNCKRCAEFIFFIVPETDKAIFFKRE